MKRKILFWLIQLLAFSFAQHVCAQAPQLVTYQCVVRDMQGNLLPNTNVQVRLSVLRHSATGPVIYAESHQDVTNSNGLITLLIGNGQVLSGSFGDISWNQDSYYLRSEIYLQSNAVPISSTMQFVSVPYALSSVVADTAMALKVGNELFTGSYRQLSDLPSIPVVPTHVSAFTNDAGYLTAETEQQSLSQVTAMGNNAGNRQLKGIKDPTEAQDAVTYHLLQEVQYWVESLQTRIDSLTHELDSFKNAVAVPTVGLPTLASVAASSITATSAVSGGYITSDGGEAVTARGVCWSTSNNPTISSCIGKTADGTGMGVFSSTITGLSEGTTYYVRAYATNSIGTAYGSVVSFRTASAVLQGAMGGLFSVAEGRQVRFAQGNLQYTITGSHACADGTTKPGTWRFAEHQYDYVGSTLQNGHNNNEAQGNVSGSDNANISSSCTGWIDLFGWRTSGYNSCNPYLTSESSSDYGSFDTSSIVGSNAHYDWGVYNAISNGGDVAGKWRVLTYTEWEYLYNGRTNASTKRGFATVHGVHGVVFLPDSWTTPAACTFASGSASGWTTNTYTAEQWAAMEGAGALFLPAAGFRFGTTIFNVGSDGNYWSSDAYETSYACYLEFRSSYLSMNSSYRSYGLSVRLVCE